MAIYIWMLCCKCHKNIKLHLYSCSKNKNDIFVKYVIILMSNIHIYVNGDFLL